MTPVSQADVLGVKEEMGRWLFNGQSHFSLATRGSLGKSHRIPLWAPRRPWVAKAPFIRTAVSGAGVETVVCSYVSHRDNLDKHSYLHWRHEETEDQRMRSIPRVMWLIGQGMIPPHLLDFKFLIIKNSYTNSDLLKVKGYNSLNWVW